jgi:dienelactone hydrolase
VFLRPMTPPAFGHLPTVVGRKMLLALLVSVCALASQAWAQGAREETVRIPSAGVSMIATVMRPPVDGKYPLVVINHGSPAGSGQRLTMARPRFASLSSWFVSRGYVVVLPLRRGYGETGGAWAETYGSCQTPDYFTAGLQGAADIKATIDFMRGQPYVTADRTIVVGQSAGGWATIALSSLNPPGVPGMVNFAGGRGGHQQLPGGGVGNCTPEALVKAAGRYGSTARVPTLWLYTANDSFFEPTLARRMVEAYDTAGGKATLRALGAFAQDGHALAGSEYGVAIWSGPVSQFLDGLR